MRVASQHRILILMEDWPSLPTDPRLVNLDNPLIEAIFEHFKPNLNLIGIHLRDARNILAGVKDGDGFAQMLPKAVVILSAAALEANLAYLSDLCLTMAKGRPPLFSVPELDYLRGTEQFVDDKGDIRSRHLKQSLDHRLKTIPKFVARIVGREYKFPGKGPHRKLQETIAWRDAIVHPRWDRYVNCIGWFEAAQSIDAVELYLDSLVSQVHPYISFYFPLLYTLPKGYHKDEGVEVAHRTRGRRNPGRKFVVMGDEEFLHVLTSEWLEAKYFIKFAIGSQCERDSGGSMLTRAALVLLYAMLDAHLSLWTQAYLKSHGEKFEGPEVLFLTETVVGVGNEGDVEFAESHQKFKQRVTAVPRILARRILNRDVQIQLGDVGGRDLLFFKEMRDRVMHPVVGEDICRVTKDELKKAETAVLAYFAQIGQVAPEIFKVYTALIRS